MTAPFQHRLIFDRSSLTRWRQRMGEDKLKALLQESLAVATKYQALKPQELSKIVLDTTVQPKNVMFPTEAKLAHRAREIVVRQAMRSGIELRQSAINEELKSTIACPSGALRKAKLMPTNCCSSCVVFC